MRECCLVIDRGTTKIKAALYDFEGNEIAVAARPCEKPHSPIEGYAEYSMPLIWEQVKDTLQALFADCGYTPEEVKVVGVCGHGNGLYMIDSDGKPVRNAILSIDRRSNAEYAKWVGDGVLEAILSHTNGTGLDPQSPAILLKWMREYEPETLNKAKYFFSSKDWVRFCLTSEPSTDRTETSGNGLVNIRTRQYADEVFELLGIPECNEMRTPLLESYEIAGYVTDSAAKQTGLCKGTPVITGAHDICACSLGTGGLREGHLVAITGTLGINMSLSARSDVKSNMLLNSILPNYWSIGGTSGGFAASLDWFVNLLCEKELDIAREIGASVFSLIEPMVASARGSDILCHPYLFGGALTNMRVKGGLLNMSSWNTKADVLRSVYEGLVFAQCADIECLPYPIDDIYLAGGCSNSPTIASMFANVLGQPVKLPAFKEAACRGVALCAINTYLGRSVVSEINSSMPTAKIYEPDASRVDQVAEHFTAFKQASAALLNAN